MKLNAIALIKKKFKTLILILSKATHKLKALHLFVDLKKKKSNIVKTK